MNVLPVANHIAEPDINTHVCRDDGNSEGEAFASFLSQAGLADTEENPEAAITRENRAKTDLYAKSILYSDIAAIYVQMPFQKPVIKPEAEPIIAENTQESAALSPVMQSNLSFQDARPADEISPEYIIGESTRTTVFEQESHPEAPELTGIAEEENKADIAGGIQVDKDTVVAVKNMTEPKSTGILPDKVISILESEKETVSQSENPVIFNDIPDDEKQMARMPQENTIKGTAGRHGSEIVSDAGDSEDLCPLENENDVKLTAAPPKANNKTGRSEDNADDENETRFNLRSIDSRHAFDIRPEKLISEQKLDMAVKEAHSVEKLFDVMVEKIEFLRTDGSDKMEVRLKPEHLGKVIVELSSGDEGLKVKIRADDPEVKSLIGGQIDRLLESLNEKGIKVAEVNVVYTGITDQSSEQHGAWREEKKRGSSRILSGLGGIEPAVDNDQTQLPVLIWDRYDAHDMEPTISSVEYRA